MEYEINVTVPGDTVVEAELKPVDKEGTLVFGENDLTITCDTKCYEFTPETSEIYYFYSAGSKNYETMVLLYDANGILLEAAYSVDGNDYYDGINWNDFSLKYSCEEGETYYIGISIYYNGDEADNLEKNITLNISNNNPKFLVVENAETGQTEILTTDEEKCYEFIPETYYFYFTSYSGYLELCLYDEAGNELGKGYVSGGLFHYFLYTCEAGGTYYLGLRDYKGLGNTCTLYVESES